jgi:hypothetical protein
VGPSWSWSYDSWIYNYRCNQCPPPLKLWVRVPFINLWVNVLMLHNWKYGVRVMVNKATFINISIILRWSVLLIEETGVSGPSWSWSYDSWIYNYRCNQCPPPLKLWVRVPFMARSTRYNIMWSLLSVTCDR